MAEKFTKGQRDTAAKAITKWQQQCKDFEEDMWNEMVSEFILDLDLTEEQAEDLANGRWF